MATRAETAAATRQSLLDAAGALLDIGGPEAVTLREVGARAGVSRSAPYRHFPDKESLLTALATDAWSELGDALEALARSHDSPDAALRAALLSLVTVGRTRPHLYRLMFAVPSGDPTALARAAERTQDLFLEIVARIVGPRRARQFGALLLTSAHGITGLELSGHLVWDKWQTDAERLIDTVIGLLPRAKERPGRA
ncbi:TetR/AcrR family transcriptional regulator [Mycobacterium sp. 050134]|uniref:TetR/AcrR family transcriptional regulator n=1 Tax=Mycobacterium sp. 050134 TaxID=3096111 RepID=UPI002ED7820E